MGQPQNKIFYIGDTIELSFILYLDKAENIHWDLTDNKIRFSLVAPSGTIKKATSNVTGGSDEEIIITDASEGEFTVIVAVEDTEDLAAGDYEFQINIEKADGKKYTLPKESFRLLANEVDWTTK